MSYKRVVLIFAITIISIALVYFLVQMEQSVRKETGSITARRATL